MIGVMKTVEERLVTLEKDIEKGCWINLINPSEEEIANICEQTGILPSFLHAALDEEERSHIETEDGQLLLLVNIPFSRQSSNHASFGTMPLGIVLTGDITVTVCLSDNPIIKSFVNGNDKGFYTFKKSRFVLQILYRTATAYLHYLKQINREINRTEKQIPTSMKNEELFRLFKLKNSLVYFTTALRGNAIVMEKLLRRRVKIADPEAEAAFSFLRFYAEDEDLLEDVITENKQAIEMAGTYSNILSGMMNAFASIISNNLNMVMKFLTSVTIIVALPTLVASLFGMNVALPLQHTPHAFLAIIGISFAVSSTAAVVLSRKSML